MDINIKSHLSFSTFGRDGFWPLESVLPLCGNQWSLRCGCPAKDCNYLSFLLLCLVSRPLLHEMSEAWVWVHQSWGCWVGLSPLVLILLRSSEHRREAPGSRGWWDHVQMKPGSRVSTWKWAGHWRGAPAGTFSWTSPKCLQVSPWCIWGLPSLTDSLGL